MERPAALSPDMGLDRSIAAVLDWWREAGVDCAYSDAPQRWLAEPGEPPAVASPATGGAAPDRAAYPGKPAVPQSARIGGEPVGWPGDLPAFRRWWCEEPGLAPAGALRVPPRGEPGAALLVLVAMPEAEDRDALLCGPEGRFVSGMARAMGVPAERLYLASALPAHIALPDWPALARDGLGEVLLHQIALAAPERVLAMGNDILPLLGHDPAHGAPAVNRIAIQGRPVPLLGSISPRHLLGSSRLRAKLWRQWLDWTHEGR